MPLEYPSVFVFPWLTPSVIPSLTPVVLAIFLAIESPVVVEALSVLEIAEPSIPTPPEITPPTIRLTPSVTGAKAAPKIEAALATPFIVFPATLSFDVPWV